MPTALNAMRHIGEAAKKGDGKASQTVSFSQIVSLVSDRLTSAENGEWTPHPRHSDGDLPPLPSWERGWGEGARPPHEAKPPTPTRRIRGHIRTTCYNPQYTLRNGDPRP